MEALHGFPPCPICDEQLHLRHMPDKGETPWYCKKCGTQWETPDIIEALNQIEDLACVLATEAVDAE